jgi:hypothetical protein
MLTYSVQMNRLSTEKRAAILGMLVEGNSLRATTRMAGCSINTVSKLLDVGAACAGYQDEHMRDLSCKTIEADEIWSFVYSKQKNVPEELQGPVRRRRRLDVDGAQREPDPAKISTSYVERQNLTMRMGMRRFTRLTNGFSKKLDNHMAAIALHFMHYNFARTHKTLADPYPRASAMAAGVTDHVWTMQEMAALLD